MDIEQRIKRRKRRSGRHRLIEEYEYLSPINHIDEPVGRGPIVERLLDLLNPVFSGHLPPNGYVYGPPGVGKSAIVSVLFRHLGRTLTEVGETIQTTTRSRSPVLPAFIYIDTRESESEFALYHTILNCLVDEPVPKHGISTENIRDRLHEVLQKPHTGVLIAVDHVSELERSDEYDLPRLFQRLPANVSWLAIGQDDPESVSLTEYTSESIHVGSYQRETLVDILMTRASAGLAQQALDYSLSGHIAGWADGNAHDALSALLLATVKADESGRDRITNDHVVSATEQIPKSAVPLGRVFALPSNWQSVLRELVDLADDELASVTETTEALAVSSRFDLSQGTIKRILYELADQGIVERIQNTHKNEQGRPSSRIEPRFSTDVFRWLYDKRAD